MQPKVVGERTEGIVLAELLKRGYTVSLPFGGSQRYDFILDDGQRLLKAQCKTGRMVNGVIIFNACSVNGLTHVKVDYRGQIDIFLVHSQHTGKVYSVPVDAVGRSEGWLRVEQPKRASASIRMAVDFEIKDCPRSIKSDARDS